MPSTGLFTKAVGDSGPWHITATGKDLERAVADGSFRDDPYYRVNVFVI